MNPATTAVTTPAPALARTPADAPITSSSPLPRDPASSLSHELREPHSAAAAAQTPTPTPTPTPASPLSALTCPPPPLPACPPPLDDVINMSLQSDIADAMMSSVIPLKILIADDDLTNRKLLRRFLFKLGYTNETASALATITEKLGLPQHHSKKRQIQHTSKIARTNTHTATTSVVSSTNDTPRTETPPSEPLSEPSTGTGTATAPRVPPLPLKRVRTSATVVGKKKVSGGGGPGSRPSLVYGDSLAVDEAVNGVEAFNKMQDIHYDVVFMDMQMPKCSGVQATQLIRAWYAQQTERAHGPWIVALTANALDQHRQECLEAGMNAYLSKPFNQMQLKTNLVSAGQAIYERIYQQITAGPKSNRIIGAHQQALKSEREREPEREQKWSGTPSLPTPGRRSPRGRPPASSSGSSWSARPVSTGTSTSTRSPSPARHIHTFPAAAFPQHGVGTGSGTGTRTATGAATGTGTGAGTGTGRPGIECAPPPLVTASPTETRIDTSTETSSTTSALVSASASTSMSSTTTPKSAILTSTYHPTSSCTSDYSAGSEPPTPPTPIIPTPTPTSTPTPTLTSTTTPKHESHHVKHTSTVVEDRMNIVWHDEA